MRDEIQDRLDAQFESYSVVRQLHDVPPHEVYEVIVDGRRAVCKVDTGETGSAGMEGYVTEFVDKQTSVSVPEIIDRGEDYYIATWHPDAPDVDGEFEVNHQWAAAAGRGLAKLHEETADHLDGYGQFQPNESGRGGGRLATTGHDDWHAAALEYIEEYRPTLVRYGHEDIADRVAEFLEAHPNAFSGADGPVCCHGWATPEHVSVRDGEIACMVDFEHAIAAPGEFEYWRTVMPAFGPNNEESRQQFRESYESVRPLPEGFADRQPLYVLLNLVYFFESLYVQDQHGPEETEQTAQRLRESVTEQLETLEQRQA